MEVRPVRLRVREGGIKTGDERRTPKVGRRPAVWLKFRWGRYRDSVGLEKIEHVGEEEASISCDLRKSDMNELMGGVCNE